MKTPRRDKLQNISGFNPQGRSRCTVNFNYQIENLQLDNYVSCINDMNPSKWHGILDCWSTIVTYANNRANKWHGQVLVDLLSDINLVPLKTAILRREQAAILTRGKPYNNCEPTACKQHNNNVMKFTFTSPQ